MGLSEDLQAILAPLPGVFGAFARNLDTDEVAEVNAAQVLPTESAGKTFVLLHYGRLVASGGYEAAIVKEDESLACTFSWKDLCRVDLGHLVGVEVSREGPEDAREGRQDGLKVLGK